MKYFVTIEDKEYEFDLNGNHDRPTLILENQPIPVDFKKIGDSSVYSLLLDGQSYEVWVQPQNGTFQIGIEGASYLAKVEDERKRLLKQLTHSDAKAEGVVPIHAPMPGLVVRISVEKGTSVEKGQGLMVIEAMKMENEIKAPVAGVIQSIGVKQGEAIDKNALLLEIRAD
ncbi:MAG: biotin/lipoyl-binding protein [Calditrichaeota bacterium]|nr:biotin/lipoyl-binding protein [Calditrichota bacterium]